MAKKKTTPPMDDAALARVRPYLITDRQFAELLQVSVRTIHQRAADDPTFPVSIRVGRSRRWVLAEAEEWCRSQAPRDEPPSRKRD